jgi:hypothetical protein
MFQPTYIYMQREIIPCPKAVVELAKDGWGQNAI